MIDPLAEVVTLLQPGAPFSKSVSCAGAWQVRRSKIGQPFYCAIIEGQCRLSADGLDPIVLEPGDFVLIPAAEGFTMSSLLPVREQDITTPPVEVRPGEFKLGDPNGLPDVRMLVGHCEFGSPDAALLVSLLPQLLHVRGESRLTTLVQLVGDESRARRPARDVITARLLEVLLIEALRTTAGNVVSRGLLSGLGDERLAVALHLMHQHPTRPWTVAQLAKEAALSRSTFFERFNRAVGITPMEYLLTWRMALAKDLLRKKHSSVADVAERVGYGSAATFSVAFSRHVGLAPTRYAQAKYGPPSTFF